MNEGTTGGMDRAVKQSATTGTFFWALISEEIDREENSDKPQTDFLNKQGFSFVLLNKRQQNKQT
jgi:hypothetical protein